MMTGKNRTRWQVKLTSWVLAVALLLSLCTGCGVVPPDDGDTDAAQVSDLQWTDVITGVEIDTLNVVLVIDTSTSILNNDPARNWLEAPCMFLNTLYASASQNESRRLPGSKSANVDVILYNDTTVSFSETLMNLASKMTVDALKGFIRNAEISAGHGDSALTESLKTAVDILYKHSAGQLRPFERSMILLFTDGYTPKGSNSPLSTKPKTTQIDEFPSLYHYASFSMPDFEDDKQTELETALSCAKEHGYETFILMWNPDDSADGGWEEFKKISDYTKRNLMREVMQVLSLNSHWDLFESMSLDNFST